MDEKQGFASALNLPPSASAGRRRPTTTKIPSPSPKSTTPSPHGDGSRTASEEAQFGRSEISDLWLKSRTTTSPNGKSTFRLHGESRPVTYANFRIGVRLLQLVWLKFASLFWTTNRFRMIAFLVGKLVQGVLPAARIWTMSQLLDEIQMTFEKRQVDEKQVLWLAFLSLLSSAGSDIYQYLSQHNTLVVQNHVNLAMEGSFLEAQLSLDIPSLSSPYMSSLMYEAGVFTGYEQQGGPSNPRGYSGGPFQTLNGVFASVTLAVEVLSQGGVMYRALSSATASGPLSQSSLILILLSFSPAFIQLFAAYVSFKVPRSMRRAEWQLERREANTIRDLVKNGAYRQEVVLFQLQDWIMMRWRKNTLQALERNFTRNETMGILQLLLGLLGEFVQVAFYVLLALRSLSTSLTLGSIRLYETTAKSLFNSIRRLVTALESAFQTVFVLAAYCEALQAARRDEWSSSAMQATDSTKMSSRVNYEDTRLDGGMRIEARNLSFTYPNANEPVLKNINLTVEAGETLAIVGFNGGGKTTLVKVLMGLYDHEGELNINHHPARAFSPAELHDRTSCLFQDFSRFNLTLRENIGLGNVPNMDDDGELEEAIVRGGAEAIKEKLGLDRLLDKSGVPDSTAGGEGGSGTANAAPADEDDDEPGRGPPPPGALRVGGPSARGRGGPPGGLGRGPPPGIPPPMGPPGGPDLLSIWMGDRGKKQKIDKGAALSGGQWQRVALARAFLRANQADLVVFDEPSAALDPRAEAELFHRIHALSRGDDGRRKATTIYISHRFSTVRKADKIAVVEEGTITELGSHIELMALEGRYYELFNLQKEGFA